MLKDGLDKRLILPVPINLVIASSSDNFVRVSFGPSVRHQIGTHTHTQAATAVAPASLNIDSFYEDFAPIDIIDRVNTMSTMMGARYGVKSHVST